MSVRRQFELDGTTKEDFSEYREKDYSLAVRALKAGDPGLYFSTRDGKKVLVGIRLGELTSKFGSVAEIRDPSGVAHEINLDQWRALDPNSFYLQIGFSPIPD